MSTSKKPKTPPPMSDEALRAWYADLVRFASDQDPENELAHMPPPVEPTIARLREAYETMWRSKHLGGQDSTQGEAGWHRALHKAGWEHG